MEYVPRELRDRVFVLGVWSEPERLKADLNSRTLEKIGTRILRACSGEPEEIWAQLLLKYNYLNTTKTSGSGCSNGWVLFSSRYIGTVLMGAQKGAGAFAP